MKIKKKLRSVPQRFETAEFVDKWGIQYRCLGLHLEFYRGGRWYVVSWFSDQCPDKLWRIK